MRLDLSSIDAINNLDTARMALRWSLERLRTLETLQAEETERAEREAGLRKSLEKTYQESRLAVAKKIRDHDSTVRALREQLQSVLDSRIEMERSSQGKFKAFELTQAQARAALEERARNLEADYASSKADLEKSYREREEACQVEWESKRKLLEQSHAQECQRLLQKAAEREADFSALQDQLQATRDNRVQAELVFQEKLKSFEKAQAQAQAALEERTRNLEAHFAASKANLERSHHEKVKGLEAERDKLIRSSAQAQASLEALQVKLAEEFQQTIKTREIADETRRAAMERSSAAEREKFSETIASLEDQIRRTGSELRDVREEKEREKEALLREMNDWRQQAQGHLPHALELEKRVARAEEIAQEAQNAMQRQALQSEEQKRAWDRQKAALEAKLSHDKEALEKAGQGKLAAVQFEQQKRFEALEHAHAQERQGLLNKLAERESALGALQEQLQSAREKGLELDLAYQEKLKVFERTKAEARASLAERERTLEAEYAASKAALEQSYREKAAFGEAEWEGKVKDLQEAWEGERRRANEELQAHREEKEREKDGLLLELNDWRQRVQGHLSRVLELEKNLARAEETAQEAQNAMQRQALHAEEQQRAWDRQKEALEAKLSHDKEALEKAGQGKLAAVQFEHQKRFEALEHAHAQERQGLLNKLGERESALGALQEQLQSAREKGLELDLAYQEKLKVFERTKAEARASLAERERTLEAEYAASKAALEQSYREKAAFGEAEWEGKARDIQEAWEGERRRANEELQALREEKEREKDGLLLEMNDWRQRVQGHISRALELEKNLARAEETAQAAQNTVQRQALQSEEQQRAWDRQKEALEAKFSHEKGILEKAGQEKLAALQLEQQKRFEALEHAHAQERQGLLNKLGEHKSALGALQEQLQIARDKGLELDLAFQEKLKIFERTKAEARASLAERERTLEAEYAASKAALEQSYREKAAFGEAEWEGKVKDLQASWGEERHRLIEEFQDLQAEVGERKAALEADFAHDKDLLEKASQEKLAALRAEQEKRLQALEHAQVEERRGLLKELEERETAIVELRGQLQAARTQRIQSDLVFQEKLKSLEQAQALARAAAEARERTLETDYAAGKANLEQSYREKAALDESRWEDKIKFLQESWAGERQKLIEEIQNIHGEIGVHKSALDEEYARNKELLEKEGQEKLAAVRMEQEKRLQALEQAHAQERQGLLNELDEIESAKAALRDQLQAMKTHRAQAEGFFQEKIRAFEQAQTQAQASAEERERALEAAHARDNEILEKATQEKLAALRMEQEKRLQTLEQAHAQERQGLLRKVDERESAIVALQDQLQNARDKGLDLDLAFQEKLQTFEKAKAEARTALEERSRTLEAEHAASKAQLEKSYREKTALDESEWDRKMKALQKDSGIERQRLLEELRGLREKMEVQTAALLAEHARDKAILEKEGQERLAALRVEQEKRIQALEQAQTEERQSLLNELKTRESDSDILRVQLQTARDHRAQAEAAFNKKLKAFEQEQLQARASLAERERALEAEYASSKAHLEKSYREKTDLYESEWESKYKALQEDRRVERQRSHDEIKNLREKIGEHKAALEAAVRDNEVLEKAEQEKLAALRAEQEKRLQALDQAHARERQGLLNKLGERESAIGALQEQLQTARDKGLELELAYQEKLNVFERTKAEARAALEEKARTLEAEYAASKADLEKSHRARMAADEVLEKTGQEKLAAMRAEQEKRLQALDQAHAQERQGLMNKLGERESAIVALQDQLQNAQNKGLELEFAYQEKLDIFERTKAEARAALEEREQALEAEYAASKADMEKSYRLRMAADEVLEKGGQGKLAALRVEQEKRLLALEQAHGQERQALLNELAERESALGELRDQLLAARTNQAQSERAFQEKLKAFEQAQASLDERERALASEYAASKADLEKSYRQRTSAYEAECEKKRKSIEEDWRKEQQSLREDAERVKRELEQTRAEIENSRKATEEEKAILAKERNDWREKSQHQLDRILALESRAAKTEENELAMARRKDELQALRSAVAADFQKKRLELERLKQKKEQEILKIIQQYKANG